MSALKKPHKPKGTGKASKAKPPQKKPAIPQLPDLEPIFDTFIDAQALVEVACRALEEGICDPGGAPVLVLRMGVDALARVGDSLEPATMQLIRLGAKKTGVK